MRSSSPCHGVEGGTEVEADVEAKVGRVMGVSIRAGLGRDWGDWERTIDGREQHQRQTADPGG